MESWLEQLSKTMSVLIVKRLRMSLFRPWFPGGAETEKVKYCQTVALEFLGFIGRPQAGFEDKEKRGYVPALFIGLTPFSAKKRFPPNGTYC